MTAGDVYRALWRYKFLIAVLTGLVGVGAWFAVSRETRIYEASTLVRIQQHITNPGQSLTALASGQKLAETYADIVATSTIARGIDRELEGRVPERAIAGHVDGEPVQDLDLLWIRARSPSPVQARQIANAAPQALRDFIHRTGTTEEHVITAQEAALPTTPVSPHVVRTLVLAILAGLILNSALALAIQAVRDPIGDAEQLARITSVPLLATVPTLRLVVAATDPRLGQLQPLPPLPDAEHAGTG